MTLERRLNSPGAISDRFLLSRAFVCGIVGPVGSGKSLTNLRKMLRLGKQQLGTFDERTGVTIRRARCGVIRDTYPNIEKHILPSWFRIIPREVGKFTNRAPFSHRFKVTLAEDARGRDIDILDMEMEFRAIGEGSAEEACRGWEVNGVAADEFDLLPEDLVPYLSGRVGRFSDLDPNSVVDPQICVSLNAPLLESYAYRVLYEQDLGAGLSEETLAALKGRPLIETFTQPGGLEPNAENLHNLPGGRGYYLLQEALNKHKPGYVERMIHNKPVPMQHGQPVYADFSHADHVTDDLDYDPRRKLVIGVDQGLFAAAVFTQRTAMGELRVLDEVALVKEEGKAMRKLGPTAFGGRVKAQLLDRFGELRPDQVRVVADPAAFAADDREDNEQDWLLAFQAAVGFKVHKAKSNRQELRCEVVRRAQSERGGYLVHRRCKHLIRAHAGGYHYRKAEIAGRDAERETRGHLEIADTIYTHVADAEQYAALEGEHVVNDVRGKPRRSGKPVTVEAEYNMFGGNF
jgi:hypothetical protein